LITLHKNISYGASFKIALTNTIHSEFWLQWKQNENCQLCLQSTLPFNVKLDKICAIHIVSFLYIMGYLVGTHVIYIARVTRV